ncbi:hypothetical protein [Duganella sp. Root1480D1]|uniref:hypothetical protein n=1 Tax=Duganella sp. Root1480D1 TaxID=1736471 RepID=UPI0007137BAD|nr:hypothetical protein [Duganella sp. Root1480D1]KQZ34242.1 hypothetical protein ASD58_28625 [Duganella sp. Root1480D1]
MNTLLGKALDRVFLEAPLVATFEKQKGSGHHLRRYFHAGENTQREIVFYRDKWWTANGGTLYAELCCLVPEVQHAVHGMAQSLLSPDYNIPSNHFQYVLMELEPKRSWELHSPEDVAVFEREIGDWLRTIALPWLNQFESRDGVIRFLQSKRQFVTLATYLASLGDGNGASQAVATWLEGLPRRIENSLGRLAGKGLISPDDAAYLTKASIQIEEDYKQQVFEWLGHRTFQEY